MTEPGELERTEDDGGETLVTPRFDEEETVLAQPVVPIDADAEPPGAASAPPYARMRRSQWPLALILISALAGSVIGGTALYFFQKHRRASASAPASAPQQMPEPAAAAQPQPTPAAEQAAEVEPAASEPVVESAEPVEAPAGDESRRDEDDRGDDIPAPAPPPVSDDGPSKRGSKAEKDDDSARRRERRADREEDDARPSGRREARRVDTITYPTREERREARREERRAQRRAERRERREGRNVDRLRAIFEGQP